MTNAYSSLLAFTALLDAIGAGFVFAQSPDRRATRVIALMLLAAAWWSLCELFFASAASADEALLWLRIGTPGWVFIAGLTTDLVVRYLEERPHHGLADWRRRARWTRRAAYALGLVCLPMLFADGWLYGALVQTDWGWDYRAGPALQASYVIALPAALGALAALPAFFRLQVSESERQQARFIWLGISGPLLGVMGSEVLLPLLQWPFPRLGGASFAVLALVAIATSLYYGVSFLSPTVFSNEMLDTLPDGVALLNRDGRIRSANGGLARLSGYSEAQLIGMPAEVLFGPAFKEPAPGRLELRAQLTSESGAAIPVSISTTASRDRRGHAMGLVAIVRDLREIEDLRGLLMTQARLAAVGELAAGIAHEINNPLAFVRANLALLGEHWPRLAAGKDAKPELEEIAAEGEALIQESLEGVDRAGRIVREIKTFTHAGAGRRERCELNDLVERAIAMLQPALDSPGVRIETDLGRIPSVVCAAEGLEQVFMNLIVNAAQAIGECGGGSIRVSTRVDGRLVTIGVEDDGPGIPSELVERVFDPFFTTKKPGEGTGLGLGIAYQVVRSHEGVITVDSRPGEGACFRVHLPIVCTQGSGDSHDRDA